MSERLVIQSHAGPYEAVVDAGGLERLDASVPASSHFIVDGTVARLYADDLPNVLRSRSVLLIEASESAKSLERFPAYVEHLVGQGIRRSHALIAIGGGVIQDITCFLGATLLRGVPWEFYPTTLLAQADSCIGSKSSINVGSAKNILGTFTPPRQIVIVPRVLKTLTDADRHSGIGEMLKVHAIAGPEAFDEIARDYGSLQGDETVMARYIRRSLEIKKAIIEVDEFDRGPRNVMNYGHTFGHAIEAATSFAIPHGIAITIGMDMANHVAARLGVAPAMHADRMHPVLRANYAAFARVPIPDDRFFSAIAKDKKNTDAELTLILPGPDGRVAITRRTADAAFVAACTEYLSLTLTA